MGLVPTLAAAATPGWHALNNGTLTLQARPDALGARAQRAGAPIELKIEARGGRCDFSHAGGFVGGTIGMYAFSDQPQGCQDTEPPS